MAEEETLLTFDCVEGHRFAVIANTVRDSDEIVGCPLCNGPVALDTKNIRIDPREMAGDIAGPGGPTDWDGVVLDATNGILLEAVDAAKIGRGARGQNAFVLLLQGRINQTVDHARVMLMVDIDGMANLVTSIHGVATRAGRGEELISRCQEMWQENHAHIGVVAEPPDDAH